MTTAAEHRAEAERLLREAELSHAAEWKTAFATRALAHATLAGLPDPVLPGAFPYDKRFAIPTDHDQVYGDMSGADLLPEVISFRGAAVRTDTPFTRDDARQLDWHLKNEERA